MQLDWVKSTSKKASPVFVHLFMVIGVALYTIFGAIVMRSLEAKPLNDGDAHEVSKRAIEQSQGNFSNTLLNFTRDHGIRHSGIIGLFRDANTSKSRSLNVSELLSNGYIGPGFGKARGRRELAHLMRNRKCVISALQKLIAADCSEDTVQKFTLKLIDGCYHTTVDNQHGLHDVVFQHSLNDLKIGGDTKEYIKPWSFSDSILFAFTVITTIGYGNVAPRTFSGRLFCIFYGLIGIPFTLLAIADLGKFISEIIDSWERTYKQFFKSVKKKFRNYRRGGLKHAFSVGRISTDRRTSNSILPTNDECKPLHQELVRDKSSMFDTTTMEAIDTNSNVTKCDHNDNIDIERGTLSVEAPEVSEKKEEEEEEEKSQAISLLLFFIFYIFCGAALLSAYEPDMTFFKAIYFNFVSLSSIGLGDIYPRSDTYMAFTIVYIAVGLALTTIAIEIAADYLKKLHYFGRKIENVGNVVIWFGGKRLTMRQLVKNLGDQFNLPTTTIKNLDLDTFVDNAIKVEEGELETLRPPPLEPADLMLESSVTFADDEKDVWIPQKTPTPSPPPRSPTPPKSPSPVPTPPRTPTPPKTPTPVQTPPRSPTPPKSPSPVPSPPKSVTPPKSPSPVPEPEPVREPTPEPEEPEKPKVPTAAELAAQKRRAYSEEAWRRYQEYQKQWRKFRQTQHAPANNGNKKQEEGESGPSTATSPVPTNSGGNSRSSSSLDNRPSISSTASSSIPSHSVTAPARASPKVRSISTAARTSPGLTAQGFRKSSSPVGRATPARTPTVQRARPSPSARPRRNQSKPEDAGDTAKDIVKQRRRMFE